MKIIDFKTSPYFSVAITLAGVLVGIAGLAIVGTNPILGAILFFLGLVVSTTHYRLNINFNKKVYFDYVWILGLKSGEKESFKNIEYLFVKKSKVSQTMNLRVVSSTIKKEVYDGYLKFSESNKLHLLTKDSKNDLINKLRVIATALNVKVVDYSDGEAKEI